MKKIHFTLRTVLILLLITAPLAAVHAQPYMHAAGIRAGLSSGISYKGFRLHRMSAAELDLLYNRHGFNLNALYEYHLEPFRKSTRTFAYLGGGAFGGNWNDQFSIGVAVVAGLEYTLRDLPLNFSLDWKPMLNLYAEFEPEWLDFGLSIRYRFSK
jgi:opacity protein-like surface antigen